MKAMFRPSLRVCQKNESGSVAVEFAFIGMLLIVITLGALELGRILYMYHNLSTAVGTTTRLIEQHAPESVIINSISSHFLLSDRTALMIDVDPSFVRDGVTYTRVEARYELPLLIPNLGIFPGDTYTVRTSQLVPTS